MSSAGSPCAHLRLFQDQKRDQRPPSPVWEASRLLLLIPTSHNPRKIRFLPFLTLQIPFMSPIWRALIRSRNRRAGICPSHPQEAAGAGHSCPVDGGKDTPSLSSPSFQTDPGERATPWNYLRICRLPRAERLRSFKASGILGSGPGQRPLAGFSCLFRESGCSLAQSRWNSGSGR